MAYKDCDEVSFIESKLQDDISRDIFHHRVCFGLTENYKYMRRIFRTIPKGREFEAVLEKNKTKKMILFGAGAWGRWIKQAYDNYS